MGNDQFRSFLLYVLLQALLQYGIVDTISLEVVFEGDRSEMKCSINSTFGIDWDFKTLTNNYDLTREGLVPDPFKSDYELSNCSHGSYKTFYLSLRQTRMRHVGTYICKSGENQHNILTSVELALLTIPKCEPDADSNSTMRSYVCNFTSVGNISSRLEWIRDYCTNSTLTTCSNESEENVSCEFPINGKNRTFLPLALNLASHSIDVCEISCMHFENTSTDGAQNTNVDMSIQVSVLLQCSVKPFSTTKTPKLFHDEIVQKLKLYGSIAASAIGVLLAIIIIVIFRNTGACCSRKTTREENKMPNSAGTRTDNGDPIYYELEHPYAEIDETVPLDNNYTFASVPTENAVVDNVAFSWVPRTVGSQRHLGNAKVLNRNTYDDGRSIVCPGYAEPYDSVPISQYAEVYQDKPENLC